MPQGQVVPEQSDVAEIMGLVTRAQQAVIVEVPRQEDLTRHIDEVVDKIELEVDLLVKGGCLFCWMAEHQYLNRVFAGFQIKPQCL